MSRVIKGLSVLYSLSSEQQILIWLHGCACRSASLLFAAYGIGFVMTQLVIYGPNFPLTFASININPNANHKSYTTVLVIEPRQANLSSSIPSLQSLTAHVQPFRGARDLAFCLKVPLDSLLGWASSRGSGETAQMRRLAWTFVARIGDKHQIRLMRSNWGATWENQQKKNTCVPSEDSDQPGHPPSLVSFHCALNG